MRRNSYRHRHIILGLLALSVVIEGFLGVIPHNHLVGTAPEHLCDHPHCTPPAVVQLSKVEAEHSDHFCLACATHAIELFTSDLHTWLGVAGSVPASTVDHHPCFAIPGRWSLPLRGPPAFA